MLVIHARNVNEALPLGLLYLKENGERVKCRPNAGGSTTIEYPTPVATVYHCPWERVLFDPVRDANPYFHFFEALWILAGRADVSFLTRFNARMDQFSDNGKTYHGAYGARLRDTFRGDQVATAIDMLRNDPNSRRVVLQIWNSALDLNADSKDIPCNDLVFLKVRDGRLQMRVCCRSNDMVWGAYGANVVQFSMLQEYMAAHIGVKVGTLTQISDSFHVYEDNPLWRACIDTPGMWPNHDMYDSIPRPAPLFPQGDMDAFDADLRQFFSMYDHQPVGCCVAQSYETDVFRHVVVPLFVSHNAYRANNLDHALVALSDCTALDWTTAADLWLRRRIAARQADAHHVAVT